MTARRPGRPRRCTPAVTRRICERLMAGESLRAICADPQLPSEGTVYRAIATDPKFQEQYVRARRAQAERYADELIAIADTPAIGRKIVTRFGGERETIEGDMVERSRLRVDTRKWVLARLLPRRYGDRLELAGSEDAPLIPRVDMLEVARRIVFVLGLAAAQIEQDGGA